MASRVKEQKILPGGLNLLAPGDQVAEGDCLDLADWWPGAAGRLEQSPAIVTRNNPVVFSPQDSICQVDGRIYYGGGGNLRQIGRIGDAAIDTGYDGYPLGLLSYQGYVWVMNRSRQKKDDGTTVTDWTPSPPGISTLEDGGVDGAVLAPPVNNPPEVGGLFASEYSYYTTWQLGTLGETNPSPAATITPALDGSIVRVHADASPPAAATGWNIYRKSPTFSAPYRLNENVLDIARTYVDDYGDEVHTHSDTQLLQLGIIMEADHDPAPPARILANQIYNGRILAANSADHPNRIWYTPALQPGFFRGAANENDGDWVDIGTDKGDEILAIAIKPGRAIIYRSHSIWWHVGDFGADNARIEPLVPDVGIVGPRAMASTSLGDYIVWNDGVYKVTDWAQKVSTKVEPVFRGLPAENLPTMGTSHRDQCAIGYKNGRLWISYPNSSGTMIHSLILDVPTQRWFNTDVSCAAFLDAGDEFLGAAHGILALEDSYVAGATVLAFQSEYQDCGLPDHEKTFSDLVINHNTQGVTLTVTIRKNRNVLGAIAGGDEFTLATITSTGLTKQVIPLVLPGSYPGGSPELGTPITAYNLSVRITGNGASGAPIVIDGPMILHYYLEARQAKRFDSDETDHGIAEVKIVDQVELDIDQPNAGALLQVYSDTPGGAMTGREGAMGQVVPQTTTRQMQPLVLTNPAVGRLLRYTITSPNNLRLYGMRARVLAVGVYLDGLLGDFWQPQPQSIGV